MIRGLILLLAAGAVWAQTPPQQQVQPPAQPPAGAAARGGQRPQNPTRDAHTSGLWTRRSCRMEKCRRQTPRADFIIGPTHMPAAETIVHEGVPQGTVYEFTMSRRTAKSIPASRVSAGRWARPTRPIRQSSSSPTSHPAAYTRHMAVYVPKQYVPGTVAPFIVGADGAGPAAVYSARQPDCRRPRAGDDCDLHRERQRGCAGKRARAGIRHDVRPVRGVCRERNIAACRNRNSNVQVDARP